MKEIDQALCLLFAFRYALGRDTTAPTDVAAIIKDNYKILQPWAIDQIIRDIELQDGMQIALEYYGAE